MRYTNPVHLLSYNGNGILKVFTHALLEGVIVE